PPYSIKQWNRAAWENDLYGRNRYGTPPQGRADYAFFQHILASLKPDTGRCAILFPHGVLFREEERHMRNLLVQDDVIECIVGLGPNLFYNSPMEACVVICRMNKPERSRGRILFINAVNEVTRERAFSYLEDEHIERIVGAYRAFADIDGFARVVDNADVLANNANLNIPLYVQPPNGNNGPDKPPDTALAEWQSSSRALRESMDNLISEIQPPSHEHTIEVKPPDVFAAGMKGITIQLGEFSNLFAASHRQLSDVINIYGTQMAGLQMIARPDPYFLDAIANLLPQIETAQLAEGLGKIAGIDKSLASFSETFAKFIKPSIDVTELKLLAERFRDQSQVLESMKKTTDLFTSR